MIVISLYDPTFKKITKQTNKKTNKRTPKKEFIEMNMNQNWVLKHSK